MSEIEEQKNDNASVQADRAVIYLQENLFLNKSASNYAEIAIVVNPYRVWYNSTDWTKQVFIVYRRLNKRKLT